MGPQFSTSDPTDGLYTTADMQPENSCILRSSKEKGRISCSCLIFLVCIGPNKDIGGTMDFSVLRKHWHENVKKTNKRERERGENNPTVYIHVHVRGTIIRRWDNMYTDFSSVVGKGSILYITDENIDTLVEISEKGWIVGVAVVRERSLMEILARD